MVLLHGFPDTGRLWRHQVPALVDAGFQVIVPDLRGYGASDKPAEVEAYSHPVPRGRRPRPSSTIWASSGPTSSVTTGARRWRGRSPSLAPDRVDHLVALSVGHPTRSRRRAEQREKSWYMLLFQFPGIAEQWLTSDDWANFREWWQHPDADAVIAELEATGSLTPGLNYYRANVPPESLVGPAAELPPVQAPTMGVWSTRRLRADRGADDRLGAVRRGRLALRAHRRPRPLDAAGSARRVNALLLDFLPA